MNHGRIAGALALAFLPSLPAQPFIKKVIPLKDLIRDAEMIFTVKVDRIDAAKPSMTLSFEKNLKGKAPFETLNVDLTGDHEQGAYPSAELLKRLESGLPLVVFANPKGTAQARFKYHAFLYANGSWFQMYANEAKDGAALEWKCRHCEPYLRRVFKGTTDEMRQAVMDGLSGKKEPPAYDKKEKEGLGPEIEKK
jgi:hypothetical protein